MDTVKLDFEQAKAKHLLFKSRLRSILFGGVVDEAPVLSHHECAVGKWIYGHALQEYGHIPEMQELERVHEDIHTSARELIAQYKGGKQDEARHGLAEMEKIADHLVQLLSTLEEIIEKDDEASKNTHEYQPFEVSLKEFNDLLKANEQLDRQIKEYVLAQRESEDKYRVLFDSMDQGFCIIEVIFDENDKPYDWRFLEVNPAFSKQNGLTDAVGKTVLELVPNIEKHWFEIYGKIAKTGEAARFTEGSAAMGRWFDVYAFRQGGNKIAVLFTDITEQKKAEHALKDSEQRFSNLVEDSPIFVFISENKIDASISYFNKTWLDYTGQNFNEALGRSWDGIVHPDDVPGVMEIFVPAFENRQPYTIPAIRVRRKDGEYRWHFFKGNPRYSNGEFVGFIGVGIDIHDQKILQEQLQQAYDDLEIKVTFRNIELERLNKEKTEKIAELEKELEQLRVQKA